MKFKMFSVIVGTECCIASCPFCVSGVKPNKENLKERNINWNRFLKQINFKQELPFPKVMDLLRDELLPMENKYWQEHDGVKL